MPRRLLVWLGLSLALSGTARADWEVKHAADDPRVTEALYGALLKAPDDHGALSRLLAHVGRAERVKLADRCSKSATGNALLACGHLYREGNEPEKALAAYAKLDAPAAHRAAGLLLDRLGRADDALAELGKGGAEAPADLERQLALYGRAHAMPPAERKQRATAIADRLLVGADAARTKRVAEALAAVGETKRAAQLYGDLAAHGDPVTRVPLYFRQAELATDAEAYDDATAALEKGVSLLPPRDGRRREALEREVDIARKRDRLPELASKLDAASKDAATEELLGRVLDEMGDTTNAQKHLQKAIALDPRAIGARRLLVRLYTRAGDEASAIAELRKLSTATGREPVTELELAERLHAQAGGQKEAMAIAIALGQHHHDAGTHATLAALYQKWGDIQRAISEAQLLVKLEPDDPEHVIALGELYDQNGDKAAARKTWARIAPNEKSALDRRLRLADVLAEHDEGGESLAILERAGHDRPDDFLVQRKLADVLDRLKRDVEAELIYRRLIERAATNNDVANVRDLGPRWLELAVRRGSLDNALPHLSPFVDTADPATSTEVALLVARARMRQRKLDEADRLLKLAATKAKPSDRGRLLEARAELLSAAGKEEQALALIVEAAAADDTRASLLYGKASTRAAALYHDEEALRFAEKAVALSPGDPDAQERLGTLLEPRDPARALSAYDRALELDGSRDRLRLHAAELALRRGDDEGAARRYRELLGRARDEQALEEAARRAVVVHELTGRLGVLEREISPRASAPVSATEQQGTLRRLLIEIDRRYVPQLAARAEAGDAAAKAELEHVAQHALGPLLDGIVEGDRDERRAAIQLVGQLGSRGAVPLLLRLAAGEAARKGTDLPPIELRAAAAEAVIPLVTDSDAPLLGKLATDPEAKVRLAAVVALGRLGKRATHELEHALDDPHERIVAAACLALPDDAVLTDATRLVALAYDTTRPLASRACGVQLANRLAQKDLPALRTKLLANGAWRSALQPGIARALLESGDPAATQAGLLSLLGDPSLHRASSVARATVDLVGAVALAESTPHPVRDGAALRAAYAQLLAGDGAATALADLLVEHPLLPRLLDPAHAEESRAALLDEMAPQLASLARSKDSTTRALAIALASERKSSLQALLDALTRPADRRVALLALSSPHARMIDGNEATALTPLLRAALTAADWRERRAALGCARKQPELARRLAADTHRLKDDPNGLVSEVAPN